MTVKLVAVKKWVVRSQESRLLNRAMPCMDTEDPCSGGQTELWKNETWSTFA